MIATYVPPAVGVSHVAVRGSLAPLCSSYSSRCSPRPGSLHDRGEWATAITLLVFLAAACVSGAFRLGWKAPLAALVVVGGASALRFDVFDAAASTKAPTVTVIGGQGAAQPSDRR